jgi:hypothetical protein
VHLSSPAWSACCCALWLSQMKGFAQDENPRLVAAPAFSSMSDDVESNSPMKAAQEAPSPVLLPFKVSPNMSVYALIMTSILSSTFLILINKTIMKVHEFTYVYTLTTLHFLAGAIALQCAATFKAFTPKSPGIKENVLIAASAVGSVATMNLSLQYNSVGTYQMLKLLVIPCCMVVQYVSHGHRFSKPIVLSLLVMLFGVATATITDISFTMLGLCVGMVAVVTTSLFAIWQVCSRLPTARCSYSLLIAGPSPPPSLRPRLSLSFLHVPTLHARP